MDQNERMRLKKQYEQYADGQILSMLEDGPDAFVAGAYALLEEEAQARGISAESRPSGGFSGPDQGSSPQPELLPADEVIQPEAFVEIMVVNSDADQRSVTSRLDSTDIPYHFMKISVTGRDLPLALMVDQRRVEEAIGQLRQVPLAGSIILW
jgi:hypothetical protein